MEGKTDWKLVANDCARVSMRKSEVYSAQLSAELSGGTIVSLLSFFYSVF